MRRVSVVLVAVVLAWLPWPLRADAIMPPPDECPPGTFAVTSHGGPECRPNLCGRDVQPAHGVDCGAGASCRESLVRWPAPVEHPIDWQRPGFPTVTPTRGACECPPERCLRADVCVPDVLAAQECPGPTPERDVASPARSSRSGCASCAVPAGRGPPLHLGAMVLVVLAWTSLRVDRVRSAR